MTPNLFNERGYFYRDAAWHRLGTVFTEPVTARQAFINCRLDYEMTIQPIILEVPTLFGTERVVLSDKFLIVRDKTEDDPEFRVLNDKFVGPDYGLVQNMKLAEIIDQLTDLWPVETCGALGKGETVFCCLSCDRFEIKGDEMRGYFLFSNTSTGSAAMNIAYTPVRTVCQNTFTAALKQAIVAAKIFHKATAEGELDYRTKLIAQMQKAKAETQKAFTALAEMVLTHEVAEKVIQAAYPMPKPPACVQALEGISVNDDPMLANLFEASNKTKAGWEYGCQRVENIRAEARENYARLNDEFPRIAGTAWGVYNAVVETADFGNWIGDDGKAASQSALWGNRAKDKARALNFIQTLKVK